MIEILVLNEGGCEKYAPLAEQAAELFADLLRKPEFNLLDGFGNCGEIGAVVHGCARAAGYNSRLMGGKVIRHDGSLDFGDGGHFWVEMPDGIVIDGANSAIIRIIRPELLGQRFIPILTRKKRRPSMKTVKRWEVVSRSVEAMLRRDRIEK